MERIDVIIKRSDNGLFLAVPEHNYNVGLHGEGKTSEDAINDLRVVCREAKEFCPELPDFEFHVKYEVPGFLLEYGRMFSLAGLSAITGVHQKQLGHYVNGNSRPSPATAKKIEDAVLKFRSTFNQVEFA